MRMVLTQTGSRRAGAPLALALSVVLAGAVPALAQSTPASANDPVAELLSAHGEMYHRAQDSEQDPEELRTTRALNDEITARNTLAENQERADREAFEAAEARYRIEMSAADAERARYEENLRASQEARRRYDLELADWQATVEACQRGDRVRCAAGSAPPRTPAF